MSNFEKRRIGSKASRFEFETSRAGQSMGWELVCYSSMIAYSLISKFH
jgi:hypothetical protein